MRPKAPLSLRLDPAVEKRLEEAAARLKVPKYALALRAIEAAVEAIERNDNRIVFPVEFDVVKLDVTHLPKPRDRAQPGPYPPHRDESSLVEEPKPVTPRRKHTPK